MTGHHQPHDPNDPGRDARGTRIVFAQVIALETLIILALWFLGRLFS